MKPLRTLQILQKLVDIHKANPQLAMTDITNDEIIDALDIAIDSVETLIDIGRTLIQELGKDDITQ